MYCILYYVIGRAGLRGEKHIGWPLSPMGTVSSTAVVLSHMTGGRQGREAHQLVVVAYRDGQLYCACTKPQDRRAAGERNASAGRRRL